MERKFKFVGDPDDYGGSFKKMDNYNGDFIDKDWQFNVEGLCERFPEDWQEITEQETNRIPNEDQPASSMTKFEMAVFMAMQGMIARSHPNDGWSEGDSSQCIYIAKETFRQLNELK